MIEKDAVKVTTNLSVAGTATAETFSGSFVGMGAMPIGAILMWSGNPDQLPAGWVSVRRNLPERPEVPTCRGGSSSAIESRNLAEYDVNKTGGEARHTLTIAEMPSHSHGATTNPAGAHTHTPLNVSEHGWAFHNWVASGDPRKEPAATTNLPSAGQHTHNVHVSPTGGGQPFDNRPPYYALAYILYTGK